MYFGSVKFFKVLIYSATICIVIFAAVFSMIFGIKASSESDGNIPQENELPSSAVAVMSDAAKDGLINIPENSSVDEIYRALIERGISSKDIINYIAQNDSEYLDSLIKEEVEKLQAESIENSAPAADSPR